MKSFYVQDFNDKERFFRLDVAVETSSYSVSPVQSLEGNAVAGFVVNPDRKHPDFKVALGMKTVDHISVPDWKGGRLIGLDGKLYQDTDLVKSKFVDLMIFRRFQAFGKAGLVYSRWYKLKWRDWVLPSDPMMPWGGDFYQYLYYCLEKKL